MSIASSTTFCLVCCLAFPSPCSQHPAGVISGRLEMPVPWWQIKPCKLTLLSRQPCYCQTAHGLVSQVLDCGSVCHCNPTSVQHRHFSTVHFICLYLSCFAFCLNTDTLQPPPPACSCPDVSLLPSLLGCRSPSLGCESVGLLQLNNRLWPESIAHELKNKTNKKRKFHHLCYLYFISHFTHEGWDDFLPLTLKDQFLSFCSWCISLTCTQVISIMVTHTQKNFFFSSWKCSWAVCQTTWPGKTLKEAVAASSCGSCTAWANSVLSPGYCLSFVVFCFQCKVLHLSHGRGGHCSLMSSTFVWNSSHSVDAKRHFIQDANNSYWFRYIQLSSQGDFSPCIPLRIITKEDCFFPFFRYFGGNFFFFICIHSKLGGGGGGV